MWLWFYMFFFCLLTPGVMLLIGFLWKKHPPREINGAYGYRTSMSSKNQDTWDFAQQTFSRIWRRWGLLCLVLSAAAFPLGSLTLAGWSFAGLGSPELADAFGYLELGIVGVQLVFLTVGSVVPVERALRRQFDKEGNRRV